MKSSRYYNPHRSQDGGESEVPQSGGGDRSDFGSLSNRLWCYMLVEARSPVNAYAWQTGGRSCVSQADIRDLGKGDDRKGKATAPLYGIEGVSQQLMHRVRDRWLGF